MNNERYEEYELRKKYNLLRSVEIVTEVELEDNDDDEELRVILYHRVCEKLQMKKNRIKIKNTNINKPVDIDELVTRDLMSLFE